MASSTPTRGLLFVTMQPHQTLSSELFHDWYNNEHGPNRTRLPFIPNGFRYRATDLPGGPNSGTQSSPEYLAIYDITDMHQITEEPYQSLRAPPGKSQREIDTMAQIWVGRKLFDFVGEDRNGGTFFELESPKHFKENAEGNVLTTSRFVLDPRQTTKLLEWLRGTSLPAISKLPGWRRTSWFQTSYLEPRDDGLLELVVIHEFTPETDAKALPIFEKPSMDLTSFTTRTYELFYTFGSAARHLDVVAPWTSPDGLTTTIPAGEPSFGCAVESTVITPDGAMLPFRLEGNSSDDSPVLVLVNSVLVTYGIWDKFIKQFFSRSENQKYRVLRFLSRGRLSNTGSTSPVTVDLLASDIICLLDSLRIPQAAGLVGVSLGGATTLATGLKYPTRIKAFISCDTSAKSPAGNRETWGKRIEVAEKEGKTLALESPWKQDRSPEPVVGEELAEMTVRRWFVPESYQDPELEPDLAKVKDMVITNSLPGFCKGVEALFDYNYTPLLADYQGKGAFLVGAGDGVLPAGMEKLSKALGSNTGKQAGFKVIEAAGHLPMVEKPQEVAAFVSDFLAS
jgi:pimeloyl-ACP methyl ester carboxylesterase